MPGRKPLPPEPPKDSGPAPPPLPSRPRPSNGVPLEAEDYSEPDEWEDDDGAPALPPRNFSPSPEDGETYEVPDNNTPPPINSSKRLPPPPSDDDSGGEVYDELEGIQEDKSKQKRDIPPEPQEGEIYDQCDIHEQTAETGGEIYEEADVNPAADDEVGELYEEPDQNSLPKRQNAPLPPPPPSPKAPPQPPSTNTMPAAPLPSRNPGPTAQAKLQAIKKMSGEGPAQLGISLDMLGQKKAALRRVSTDKEPEPSPDTDGTSDDTTSVKDKISKFKAAESESLSMLMPKPLFVASPKLTAAVSPLARTVSQTNSVTGIKPVLKPKPLIPTSPKPTAAVSPTARPVSQTNTVMGPRPSMTVKPSVHNVTLSSRNLPPPPPPPIYSCGFNSAPLLGINQAFAQKLQPDTRSKSPTPQVPSIQPTTKQAPPITKQAPPTRVTAEPPQQAYSEEIYDDAINVLPPKDPLDGEIWYHGERDRNECETELTKNGQDGSYLVRKSIKGGDSQPYTLVVLYKSHVYNLRIRRRPDNKIALGNEKDAEQELAFDSVPELITHHISNEVILINKNENRQYRAVLKNPVRVT